MDKNSARRLWAQLCAETMGGNADEAFERVTAFGMVATSNSLPIYVRSGDNGKQEAENVASWLESWASAIRGREAQP